MVLEAVVAGSIVAGTGVGIVFKIKSWLRDEEQKREARQQARDDRLCAAVSAIGEKVDGLSVRVARLEGEFRSFRDSVQPILQSLFRPDPAPRGGGGDQPAPGPDRGAPPAGGSQ